MALKLKHALPRGRKAVFFTLIAILIVTMFVLYFRMQEDIPLKKKMEVVDSRITSMNDFVKSFEEIYAPRALYAMSHNALNFIFMHMNETNSNRGNGDNPVFIKNISEAFQMAVNESKIPLYGAGGVSIVDLKGMENMQFWMGKLANVTREELGADFNFTIYDIHLEQDYETGPWKARAVMKIGYMINSTGIAKWERYSEPISAEFDITGFIDPYIAVMTKGYVNRKIHISRFDPKSMTKDSFILLARSGNYTFENYSAPSFLFRFEGNTSPSYCCGIESFVLPTDVSPQDDGSASPPPQCSDGIDNDADGVVDLNDPDCTVEDPDKEFVTDDYTNSFLDFQFWRGRCYAGLGDDPKEYILPYDNTLWVADDIYPGLEFLKLDSHHRLDVYPGIGDYMTIEAYNEKHKDEADFVPIKASALNSCRPLYLGYDETPPPMSPPP